MTPHDNANLATRRSGAHAISNGVRHMRRIVRHKIHAIAAATTLTNRAKMAETVSDCGKDRFLRSVRQCAANDGDLRRRYLTIDLSTLCHSEGKSPNENKMSDNGRGGASPARKGK